MKRYAGRKLRWTVLFAVIAAAMVVLVPSAIAVHDEAFQLDGDIAQATSTPCHAPSLSTCPAPAVIAPNGSDWDSFFQTGTTTDSAGTTGTPGGVPIAGSLTNGFEKSVFIKDFVSGATGPDISTFGSGGKDIMAIDGGGLANSQNWNCTSTPNVGDKVDLVNTYALLYHKTGANIIYAGLERSAPEGDANAGFWFLKDNGVGCTPGVNGSNFTGQHRAGDLLVVVAYTGGGAVTSVLGFKWRAVGPGPTFTAAQEAHGCLSSNAVVLTAADCNDTPIFSGVDCKKPVTGGDSACATVNGDPNACPGGGGCKPPDFPITPPWPAEFKTNGGGTTGVMDTPQFLEMGLNLTAFNLDVGCFSKFMPDTRTSASTSATIPDYALGSFNTCSTSTVTTPSATTIDAGGSITDTAAVTGSSFFGSPPKPTGNVTFFVCGPSASQSSCADNDPTKTQVDGVKTLSGACTPDVTECATATSGSFSPTVPGRYCFRAVYAGDTNYTGSADGGSNECFSVRAVPTITTQVRNAGNTDVTSSAVAVGTVIHDHASFDTNSANNPIPAGSTATFHLFTNLTCTGASTDQAGVAVTSGAQTGTADSSTFTPAAGRYGYLVDFVSGDTGSVLSKTGTVCEPFTVVDANIQITPATAANPVGSGHTLTGHVNVNDGTGVANAPAGTLITFSIVSGPGSFVGGTSTCTTIGTTGSCTVQITSSTTGTTVVNAATDVTVAGLSLHRATGDSNVGDSVNAQKNWVDANIGITPATANNALGTNHVLTITVTALGGTIDAGPHTATASIVSGPGSFVGSPTCTYTGGAATASCTVTITSAVVGTTVVSATSNIPVNTISISRTTGTPANTASGGTGNANKTWVDANIAITPATATNPLGTNHVLTITVTALGGTIDAGPHTATASIVSGPGSFVGSPTCTYTGGAATASCTVTITSAVAGTTVVSATSNIPVNTVSITRTTNTAANTASGGSGNASKAWVDANIAITPATATNPLGTNHVLTITVNALGGTLDAGPHTATASIVSGPGSFVGSPSCTYTGGAATASCTVTITSAVTGTTVVSATSAIPVNGVTITRTTGTAANTASGGSGNASKAWVDANIAITPATATNPTGSNHVLTITVTAVGGTIDAGPHTATASIVSGPGSFVGSPTCTYTGGAATASCTVTITSAVTGTTVVSATSAIPVNGVTVTRTTGTPANTASGGSGNAQKSWVDAYIGITPANANNAIGTNHVLTITVTAVGGTIDAGPHTATASIVSGPGSFVGSPTCTYTGGAATASCTVTITSAVIGTTVVQATSAIPVNGVTITRTTGTVPNTLAGGTANANKTWVDAYISITPATATNPTGTNHVLTITVTALGGTIDAGSHTATASIVSGPGSFVGSPTCTYTGGAATASCTVTITSAAVGTTVVSATSNIPVNTVSITRTTNTAANTASGGSGNASKAWVDANIGITPGTATNSIDTTHTLTITITALGGTIDAGSHTATASIVSGPGSFVGGVNTCSYTGGAATATCTVTITSTAVGTTVVSATSGIPVNGITITRTTGTAANTASGGTGNASKTWVAGSITIVKNTVGGNGVFNFTATGPSEMPSSFSLTTVAGTKSQTFTGLPQGSYTVTETGPSAAWDFISLSCTTGGSNSGQVASITLPMGGAVTCTYTNGLKPTLKIVKNVTGGSGTFTFDTTGGAVGMDGTSLTPPANGSASAGPTSINTGASSVSEHTPLPAGWVLTDSACTGTTATGSNQVPGGSAFYTQSFTANYGDAIVCTYTDSVQILTTRTQGFWATHTALSDNVWNGTGPLPTGFPVNGSVINPIDSSPAGSPDAYLCGVLITAIPQVEENWLMGGFWSNISKKSDGKKRTALDQARMQMLQQYFAAVLNVHMFGSGSEALLVAARTAYCGTNAAAIQTQIGILGNFNTSGDNQSFDPGQSATAQLSKSYADIDAWDAPGIPGSSDEE